MSENEKLDFEGMPDAQTRKMFPDKPTAEVVAEIVAENPRAHGVTVAERLRRAKEQAAAEAKANAEFFASDDSAGDAGVAPVLERVPVVENAGAGNTGGENSNAEPSTGVGADAPVPLGDKSESGGAGPADGGRDPENQGTADERGADVNEREIEVGRHDTEAKEGVGQVREERQAVAQSDVVVDTTEIAANAAVVRFKNATCDHAFPDDAEAQTPCPKCGITFETWVNS